MRQQATVAVRRVGRKLHHHSKGCLQSKIWQVVQVNSVLVQDTFPKAPCPERWVPPPRTRGIRATALPVPQDSALVWWPETPHFLELYLIMSYRSQIFQKQTKAYQDFQHHQVSETQTKVEYHWSDILTLDLRTLTSQFAHSIRLALVLAHVGVDKIHNIRADGSPEHCRHNHIFASCLPFLGVDRD